MSPLEELGRRAASAQDRELADRDDVAAVRRRLEETGVEPARQSRRLRLAVAAGILLALGAVGLLLENRAEPPAVPEAAETAGPLAGGWITAPPGDGVPVRFDDGSTVHLDPLAEARVVAVTPSSTRLVLRRGGARVEVVHRPGARWDVAAGPFSIAVLGTRFRASWDPVAESFRLDLERGSVVVEGPLLPGGRPMEAGEILQVWVAERRVEVRAAVERVAMDVPVASGAVRPAPQPTPVPAPAESEARVPQCSPVVSSGVPGPSGGVFPPAIRSPRSVAPPGGPAASPPSADPSFGAGPTIGDAAGESRPSGAEPSVEDWRVLASRGRYAEAFSTAEADGIDRILAEDAAPDLLVLGDAARLAGRPDRADVVYREVRRRFPGTSEAGVAAFSLARIAFDLRGDFVEAVRWLDACLAEPSAAGLAREALGRRIEALDRGGSAVEAARAYLVRFPDGPHGPYARGILEAAAVLP
jgi:hypothetical protein